MTIGLPICDGQFINNVVIWCNKKRKFGLHLWPTCLEDLLQLLQVWVIVGMLAELVNFFLTHD